MTDIPDIRTKPACNREDALAILETLRQAGHVAYFAGGCVRDLLLGLEPKDFDIATDAPPNRVRELFRNTQAVGAAFGVILVRQGRSVVEVATFRAEGKYLDGRRPTEVHFTTAEEDALRRDFTINGLFLDPIENRVIDYVGGREDLAALRLRAIGKAAERFDEDYLRLLRAVRFAARFNLTIEDTTASAIVAHAPLLKRISPERIADELRLMLTPTSRNTAWALLWQFGLIHEIHRFLPAHPGTAFEPGRSIFLRTRPLQGMSFGLALAAAVTCYQWQATGRLQFEKQMIHRSVRAMRQSLRISNEESDEMAEVLTDAAALLDESETAVAGLKRFLAHKSSRQTRDLLDGIAAVGQHGQRIDSLRTRLTELEKTEFAPTPLITGDDLTAAAYTPGPLFKKILDAVYDAQLEGRIRTKDEAMAMARSLAGA